MRIGPCIALLFALFLAEVAMAVDDQGSYLNPNDAGSNATAIKDTRNTVGTESLFKPTQDVRGSPTPVMTGMNTQEATVPVSPPLPKSRLLSPLNRWHLDLKDTSDRSVELQMTQSNDAVFGRGTVTERGITQNASATAKVSGKKLSLDILTDDLTLFRMDLTMNGKSIAGDYDAFSTSYMPRKGIAMGRIT